MTKTPPRAREFMNTGIKTVAPEMTLDEAVRFLLDDKLSSAPVVEKSDKKMQVHFRPDPRQLMYHRLLVAD